jgi:hypothetical protein
MITNRFWNRVGLLVLMFMLYGIGIAAGRDAAMLAHHQHPACNVNLKP